MSVPPCFAILQVRRLEHQEWLVLVDCHTARKWVQDLHCPDRLQKVHSHTLYNTVFLIFWASPRSRHSEPPEWISSWSPIASKKNFSSTPAPISLFSLPDFHVTYRQFHSWLTVTCVPVPLPTNEKTAENRQVPSPLHPGPQRSAWLVMSSENASWLKKCDLVNKGDLCTLHWGQLTYNRD